jgi:hypothetical protein
MHGYGEPRKRETDECAFPPDLSVADSSTRSIEARPPEIAHYLNTFLMLLDENAALLAKLEGKIRPVLMASDPKEDKPSARTEPSPRTEVGTTLQKYVLVLRGTNAHLLYMIEHVGL